MNGFGNNLTQIALTLEGVALVAVVISNERGNATVIKAASDGYAGLLNVVTLQGKTGNVFSN